MQLISQCNFLLIADEYELTVDNVLSQYCGESRTRVVSQGVSQELKWLVKTQVVSQGLKELKW
jgi:hypothetical protein